MNEAFEVTAEESGQRLDIFCVGKMPQVSRAGVQKAIRAGQIMVNNKAVKPGYVVKVGDEIKVEMVESEKVALVSDVVPAEIPTLYEDKDIVVINKPVGFDVTAVNDWFCKRHPDTPGTAHRLDKDTSGVMILAKNVPAHEHLLKQFKNRHAKKEYLAVVFGIPTSKEGRIVQALKRSKRYPLRRTIDDTGKPAITEWRLEKKLDKLSLLRVFPLTGRTHQIRAHLHWLGYPIVGDHLYTFKRQRPPQGVKRQMLHAEKLTITLLSGKTKTFIAPLPDDFARTIKS